MSGFNLFGKAGHGDAKYRKVASSDDEFSLSDEEEVLFKTPREIELNLYPNSSKSVGTKTGASCMKQACLVCTIVVVIICVFTVGVTLYKNAHHAAGHTNRTLSGSGAGKIRQNVTGPGVKWRKIIQKRGFQYPCFGSIMALRGYDGKVLWDIDVRSEVLFFNCEQFDFDKDGKQDCIATGRMGTIIAFNPRNGDLMGINLEDFKCYVTADNPDKCQLVGPDPRDPWSSKFVRDANGTFIIHKGQTKGAMVTPVLADINGDGVLDVVASLFDGQVVLYDGKTATQSWVSIIDGHDGSLLWSLNSTRMQFSSVLTLGTSQRNLHKFVFSVTGRDSPYSWREDGSLVRFGVPDTANRTNNHKEGDSDGNPDPSSNIRNTATSPQNNQQAPPVQSPSYFNNPPFDPDSVPDNPNQRIGHPPSPKKDRPRRNNHMTNGRKGTDDPPDGVGEIEEQEYEDVQQCDPRANFPPNVTLVPMCNVESPDSMSTGLISDFDGDGMLDYMSVRALHYDELDAGYCMQGISFFIEIKVVSLQISYETGTLEKVLLHEKTKMPMPDPLHPITEHPTLLPVDQQTWTQFMGKTHDSVYTKPGEQ
ncbi:hypothetical protein MAR_028361 [Mya arenaria]|uniref:Uncharacterized protein n=1 Tax=Mya arenaria TaxID=6604 RepID=A0ABY7DDE8_MYAAR|nr:hypothetical protein MAR_028361 [Mya arenaria]